MKKPSHVFIRQKDKYYRVMCQHHYPHGVVEEVVLTQRFNTLAEAQDFVDEGLRAQRIYRSLTAPIASS